MANVVRTAVLDLITMPDVVIVQDDFCYDQIDTAGFVDTVTDAGTVTMGDAVGGVAVLYPSDSAVGDNDEAYFASPNEVFKLAAGKPLYAAARLQFAEANTDDANIFFGFGSAFAANFIVDNGAGMRVTGDIVGIYKVDGGTKWICISQVNGTAVTTTSATTAGGSSYIKAEVEVVDHDSSGGYATFRINNEFLKDTNGNIIRHAVPYASATEMQVGFGVKNGSTNAETLNVDYVVAVQQR